MEGIFSTKSDVYSFGVLVLEIISGRRNNSFYNDDRAINLVGYVCQTNLSILMSYDYIYSDEISSLFCHLKSTVIYIWTISGMGVMERRRRATTNGSNTS